MTDINSYTPRRTGTHPTFTSAENGCTHIAHNKDKNNVRQFKLDGEVFLPKTAPQRCDYLLLNDTKLTAYFIELKGSQAQKAIEQIEASINEIKQSISGYKVYRRIVIRRGSHGIQGSNLVQWKKKYPGSAKSETQVMEEAI